MEIGTVLYTGGERVGRIVAMAAAKHTTPVSLEVRLRRIVAHCISSNAPYPSSLEVSTSHRHTTLRVNTHTLPGKSPLIVDPKTDLQTAARRILWGKGVNAGQTCVAPDYILVPRDSQAKLVEALQAAYVQVYPSPYVAKLTN